MKETPFQVQPVRYINGVEIELQNIMELSQGGPEVGQLVINGKVVSGKERFGTPVVVSENSVFAPIFKRGFLSSGFKIARIDLKSGQFEIISKMYPLIYLIEVAQKKLRFGVDVDCSKIMEISLD